MYVWLIPVAPLAGAVILVGAGRRIGKAAGFVAGYRGLVLHA